MLLIGRRALVMLGLPVLTADYDVWLHIDDIEAFNAALSTLEPNREPEEARRRGRYVLEGEQRVDVLVARSMPTRDEPLVRLAFDDAWQRRQKFLIAPRTIIALPSIQDLIVTKRWALRPKDLSDISALRSLEEPND